MHPYKRAYSPTDITVKLCAYQGNNVDGVFIYTHGVDENNRYTDCEDIFSYYSFNSSRHRDFSESPLGSKTKIECTQILKHWDGRLTGLRNVKDTKMGVAARVWPSEFPRGSDSTEEIFTLDCNGVASMSLGGRYLLRADLSAMLRGFKTIEDIAAGLLANRFEREAVLSGNALRPTQNDGKTLSNIGELIGYTSFPSWVLYYLTDAHDVDNEDARLATWNAINNPVCSIMGCADTNRPLNDRKRGIKERWNNPSDFSYANWLANGFVSLKLQAPAWTEADISMVAAVKRCPFTSLPSFTAELQGSLVGVNNPLRNPCTQSSDCTRAGYDCLDIATKWDFMEDVNYDMLSGFLYGFQTVGKKNSQFSEKLFTRDVFTLMKNILDPSIDVTAILQGAPSPGFVGLCFRTDDPTFTLLVQGNTSHFVANGVVSLVGG